MSVTSSMQYSLRQPAAQGRSFAYQIKATNGTEHSGTRSQVVQLDVPCGRKSSFLDQSQTFLEFEVQPTAASGTLAIDSHASCFIHRLEIFHGSNLLESIDNYNVLYNMMLDAQVGGDQRNGHLSVSQGCAEGGGFAFSATTLSDYGAFKAAADGKTLMEGGTVPLRTGMSLTSGTKYKFAIPLSLSGLLSPLCPKYLPLLAMGASDLRLQITLEDPMIAMVASATGASYVVRDMTLNTNFLEFPPDVGASIMASGLQAGNGSLRMSTESYRGYESTMGVNNNGGSFLIPARFSSLTTLYATMRRQSDAQGDVDTHSLSARQNPDVSEYHFRIGSSLVPSAPVRGDAQSILELMKTFNSVSNIMHKSCITKSTYASKDAKTGGTYMIGVELSSMPNRSDVIDSGVNTISENVHLELKCTNTVAHVVNTFAKYDSAIVISDGVASVVY